MNEPSELYMDCVIATAILSMLVTAWEFSVWWISFLVSFLTVVFLVGGYIIVAININNENNKIKKQIIEKILK